MRFQATFTATFAAVLLILGAGISVLGQTQLSDYILGPGDVLEVSVWGHDDLTRVVTVRPDGKIALPLVGTVAAAGVSVEQLTSILTTAYAVYLVDPKVALIVRQLRTIRATAVGQVNRPGSYQLETGSLLLDLLSAAGGVTDAAALTQAQLLRPGEPPMVVDLLRLMAGDPAVNIALQAGDTLSVPEDMGNTFYVLGDVRTPGVFRIRGEVTLLQAIAMAGGPAQPGSAARTVYIVRRTSPLPRDVPAVVKSEALPSGGVLITVDLQTLMRSPNLIRDITIQRGDLVVVPESGLTGLQVVLNILSGLLGIVRP